MKWFLTFRPPLGINTNKQFNPNSHCPKYYNSCVGRFQVRIGWRKTNIDIFNKKFFYFCIYFCIFAFSFFIFEFIILYLHFFFFFFAFFFFFLHLYVALLFGIKNSFIIKYWDWAHEYLDQCFPTSAPGTKSAPKTFIRCSQKYPSVLNFLQIVPRN